MNGSSSRRSGARVEAARRAGTRVRRAAVLCALLLRAALLALSGVGAALAAAPVLVVTDPAGAAHRELAARLETELRSRTHVTTTGFESLDATAVRTTPPALIVTVGVEATRRVLGDAPSAPVLATLVPSRGYAAIRAQCCVATPPGHLSAVFLDQPLSRSFTLIRVALPSRRAVGVLLGPTTRALQSELEQAAARRRLEIGVEGTASEEAASAAFSRLLERADVVLAVADPAVFTPRSAAGLLLTAAAQRVPVIGYAEGLVRAGALAAVHTNPSEIAAQTVDVVAHFLDHGARTLPEPQYPRTYRVTVNPAVAEALDLDLPEAAYLEAEIRRAEETP